MKLLNLFLALIFAVNAFAGAGSFPQGDYVRMLRDGIKFKSDRTLEANDVDPQTTATPADSGSVLINDNGAYLKLDDGLSTNWVKLQTETHEINFIDRFNAESGSSGWTDYANTSAGETPDDFGGTVSGAWDNIAATTSTPLRGSKSFIFGGINSGSGDLQGHGVYKSFTIDNADKAKMLTGYFDYLIDDSSMTNADDEFWRVYIYDVTNSKVIRVDWGENIALSSFSNRHYFQFQSSPDSTSYRLLIHQAKALTSTESYSFQADHVVIEPTRIAKVATNMPVGSILTWTVDGEPKGFYLECNGQAVSRATYKELFDVIGETYGNGDGSTTFNVPDYRGYFLRGMDDGAGNDPNAASRTDRGDGTTGDNVGTIQADATAVNGMSTTTSGSSHAHSFNRGSSAAYTGAYAHGSTGSLYGTQNTNSGGAHTHGLSGDSETRPLNISVRYYISYSIGNYQMSEDLGGREIATSIYQTVSYTIADNTQEKAEFTSSATVNYDTVSAWDSSNLRINIKETGYYDLDSIALFGAGADDDSNIGISFYKNGTEIPESRKVIGASAGNTNIIKQVSNSIYLTSGDYLELYLYWNDIAASTSVTVTGIGMTVVKRSSPQTMLQTETVAARYLTDDAATNTFNTGVEKTVVYEDADSSTGGDTHGSMNTSTGEYTISTSGWHDIEGCVTFNTIDPAANSYMYSAVAVNGTIRKYKNFEFWSAGTNLFITSCVDAILNLTKGDVLTIKFFQNSGANEPIYSVGTYNTFSIARIK